MSPRRPTQLFFLALAVYAVSAGVVVSTLVRTESLVAVLAGIVIVLVPLIGFWLVWRDLTLRRAVTEMSRELDREAALVNSDGGPVATVGPEQPDPADWRSWYSLAAAFEAEDDHKRARAALRHAYFLYSQPDNRPE